MFLLIIIAAILLLSLILIFLYSFVTTVVPMPSSGSERKALCSIIKDYSEDSRFSEGMKIVDLGGGWGGLSRYVFRNIRGADIESFELSPIPYFSAG